MFGDRFGRIIKRYKKVEYGMNIVRWPTCLVAVPITDCGYGILFGCTTIGRALYWTP